MLFFLLLLIFSQVFKCTTFSSCKWSIALNNCRAFSDVPYVIMHLIWTTVNFCTVSLFQIKKIKNSQASLLSVHKTVTSEMMSSTLSSFCKEIQLYFSSGQHLQNHLYMGFWGALGAPACRYKKKNQTWDFVYYQRTVLIYIYYSGIGLIIDSAVLCRMVYSQRAWIWVVGHGPSWPHRSGSSPPYCGWRSWHSSAASRRAWAERRLQSEETRGEAVQLEQEVVHV